MDEEKSAAASEAAEAEKLPDATSEEAAVTVAPPKEEAAPLPADAPPDQPKQGGEEGAAAESEASPMEVDTEPVVAPVSSSAEAPEATPAAGTSKQGELGEEAAEGASEAPGTAAAEAAAPEAGVAEAADSKSAEQEAAEEGKRKARALDSEDAVELRRLRRRLGAAAVAVEHLTFLVTQLQHSQAYQATKRATGKQETLGPPERKALADAHTKRVSDIIAKQCNSVLKGLIGHKWGWPFHNPVDTVKFSDYTKAIKHPMDLMTIKNRIETGYYKDPEEFAADCRLVCNNAKTYNPPGSDVHIMASTLKGRFEERWQTAVVPRIADEMNTCKTEELAAERRMHENRRAREVELYERRSAQLLDQISVLEARIAEDKMAAAFLCPPVPHEERVALHKELLALDEAALGEVARALVDRYPGIAGSSLASGGLELDLNALDSLALRRAHLAVLQARKPPPKEEEQTCAEGGDAGSAQEPCVVPPGPMLSSGIRRFLPPRSIRQARIVRKEKQRQEEEQERKKKQQEEEKRKEEEAAAAAAAADADAAAAVASAPGVADPEGKTKEGAAGGEEGNAAPPPASGAAGQPNTNIETASAEAAAAATKETK